MPIEKALVTIDNRTVEITPGTTLRQYLADQNLLDRHEDNPIAIASINGRRVSLAEPLFGEDRIRLIRLKETEAHTTIQRTLLFVLNVAVDELFPGARIKVDFSYGSGTYCALADHTPLDAAQIATVEKRMYQLVDLDLALTPQRFGLRALQKMYQRLGDEENLTTARYIRRDSLNLSRMEGHDQLYYGRQLPSTGYLRAFKLLPEAPGFVLLSNVKGEPARIPEFLPQPKLLDTLREYTDWSENIQVNTTGRVNEYIVQGRTSELIQISEARHTKFFVEAAQQIADMSDQGRLVLLAGPSSSGKTSSAKRLSVQLRVLGYRPFALSLDDYFVDREDTPRSADGDYDYEALGALKVDLFNQHLKALMAGEEVHLPRFNFRTGKAEEAATPTRLRRGDPLLVEGIHALNPLLTPAIPDFEKTRIYVSALCHLNIDNISYIKTTHSRLYRRIVRDAQFRGYTASDTLARWPKVRQGEEAHIFPHQNNADLFFNSGLTYEMAVLKLWAEPRLAAVDLDDPNYGLARTLIDLLALLLPIDASQVPPTSLLREFIGGSGFNY
jgi:uridine kinase|nr:nucleoside kinase [Candidatus Krumholzibacteria bacterium]